MEDPEEVRTLLDEVKPDLVFHLGGHVTAAANLELVTSTFQSLLASTVTLLTEATRVGCRRLVLAGSLEEPIGLAAEATPTSPYGAAKWAAGAYARMFHALYGTPAVILRPFMAYGPGQPEHRVVPHAIRSYLRGVPPRLSSARRRFDWVFVDDVVDALLLAAHRPGLEGATIDLGSGQAVTVRDVVMRIKEIVGSLLEPEFGTEPDRPGNETRVADTAHTRAILGWRATIPLDAGLARAVAWYRAQPLDIRSPS
jgi:nucleoside-diphosphate-sugar epimerase